MLFAGGTFILVRRVTYQHFENQQTLEEDAVTESAVWDLGHRPRHSPSNVWKRLRPLSRASRPLSKATSSGLSELEAGVVVASEAVSEKHIEEVASMKLSEVDAASTTPCEEGDASYLLSKAEMGSGDLSMTEIADH